MTFTRSETITYAGGKQSQAYKDQMKADFGIEGADSIVPNSVRGQRTPFGVVSRRAESYTQLSRAIDAIDNGPTTSNAPPLDVRRASADLVESCKKRLVELDTKSELQGYNAKNQEEREAIFALLEDVKIANAREKNWQWASDFTASLSRQVYEGLSWAYANKWTLLTCGVIAGVAAAFAVPALLMLGPIGWGVLAFAALSFLGYLFYKVGSAISTAYNEANKKALDEKMEAGDAILQAAQETAKDELADAQKTHAEAKDAFNTAQQKYESLTEEFSTFETEKNEKITTIDQEIASIQSEIANLKSEVEPNIKRLSELASIKYGRKLSVEEEKMFNLAIQQNLQEAQLPRVIEEGNNEEEDEEDEEQEEQETPQQIIDRLEKIKTGRGLTQSEQEEHDSCKERLKGQRDILKKLEATQTKLREKKEDRAGLTSEIATKRSELKQARDNLVQARAAVLQAEAAQKAALAKIKGADQRVQKQSSGALSPISKVAQKRSFETNKTKPQGSPKTNKTPISNNSKGPATNRK